MWNNIKVLSHGYQGTRVLFSSLGQDTAIKRKTQCLKPGGWLNDEVINLYLCLFKEREEREPQKFLKCHFFSTYFYAKISGIEGYDYNSVSKWTDKIGYELLECDKIFVPINNNIHWTLAVINKKDKTLQYLDPMKRKEPLFLDILNNHIIKKVTTKQS
ncbi:ubiquitin-like-specific protease 1A [Trifolium pratense]|uniref:ubiquitin-like-specific protease 1A n=1 Tax=Trifolium pratense TaxID=57577 RepID=UPI001E6939E2|nr:ubiquitin-like-specific protease 1A [Trifolium pratense]